MYAREVKAFVHRDRAADVVEALNSLGFHHIAAVGVVQTRSVMNT